MADKTGISWTDATWNPVRGCSRVSEGCRNCYAERVAARFSGRGQPYEGLIKHVRTKASPASRMLESGREARWNGVVRLIPEHLADPLRWKKPRRVFVNSMSDLFHESLTDDQIDQVFAVMALARHHTFQVLTKRAKRMRAYITTPDRHEAWSRHIKTRSRVIGGVEAGWWPRFAQHIWLGVSVENQAAADERIPELLATPASVRFLSCEPLIGDVEIARWMKVHKRWQSKDTLPDGRAPAYPLASWHMQALVAADWRCPIDWVIAGCESGPGARPCSVDWLRSLRDQCAAARVPFFLKQAVEESGLELDDLCDECGERERWFVYGPNDTSIRCGCSVEGPEDANWHPLVGAGDGSKRKAGGVIELPYLDGVQHAAFPEVP
jgi:protein gp37